MLRRSLSMLLIMTTMGASTLTLADPPGGPGERRNDGPGRHEQHRDRGPGRPDQASRAQHSRGVDHRVHKGHGPQGHHVRRDGRAPGRWKAHERLPARYLSDRHSVRDWHRYRLPAPPPHHRWVKVDGEFILVAAATGVIASILLDRR